MQLCLRILLSKIILSLFIISVALVTPALPTDKEKKLTLDEVMAKYHESLGKSEARAELKSIAATGGGTWEVIVGGLGRLKGPASFISEGNKQGFSIELNSISYTAEKFAYDGKRCSIGYINTGVESRLGQFIFRRTDILKDGLLGGALSTRFPLLDYKNTKLKPRYEGLKTVKGTQYHEVRIGPRSEVTSSFLFDATTFRHVMSIHSYYVEEQEGLLQIVLEERFDTFKPTTDGSLILPHHWTMRLTWQASRSSEAEWQLFFNKIQTNVPTQPQFFIAN